MRYLVIIPFLLLGWFIYDHASPVRKAAREEAALRASTRAKLAGDHYDAAHKWQYLGYQAGEELGRSHVAERRDIPTVQELQESMADARSRAGITDPGPARNFEDAIAPVSNALQARDQVGVIALRLQPAQPIPLVERLAARTFRQDFFRRVLKLAPTRRTSVDVFKSQLFTTLAAPLR